MHSQSTMRNCSPALPRCCLLISRKTAGLGLVMGFSIVFKDREPLTCLLPETRDSEPSPAITQQRSLSETNTRLQGLPLRGPFHTVAPGRTDEREGGCVKGAASLPTPQRQLAGQGGGLLTQGPASGHPAQGHPCPPTLLPRKASLLFSKSLQARESEAEPLSHWASAPCDNLNHSLSLDSSPVQQGLGPGDFSRDACDEQ